jgi:hypothetical protein
MQRDPRVGFSAFPTKALLKFPRTEAGNANRGEYITGFSQRKRVLASIVFCRPGFFPEIALTLSRTAPQRRIDEFFCFE